MIEKCEFFRDQFVESLYQELAPIEKQGFEAHLSSCTDCRTQFKDMQKTLVSLSQRRHPEFSGDFWAGLEDRIEGRISQAGASSAEVSRTRWGWAYKIAAGIVLVLVGVGIDRVILPPTSALPDSPVAVLQPSALELRVAQYLGRSQLLLLGLANIDTLADGADAIDLSAQEKVSRELSEESLSLREALHEAGQTRLASLVQDLGKVMLQVSNLEERRGLRQIRPIQKSVLQSDLLLRVNLQKLRPTRTNRSKNSPRI